MQAQVTKKKNPMPKIFGMNAMVMRIARTLNVKQIRETTRLTGRTDTVPDIYREFFPGGNIVYGRLHAIAFEDG